MRRLSYPTAALALSFVAAGCSSTPSPDSASASAKPIYGQSGPTTDPKTGPMSTELATLVAKLKIGNSHMKDDAAAVAASGNVEAMQKGSERLAAAGRTAGGASFRDQKRAEIETSNKGAGVSVAPEQTERRVDVAQSEALEPILQAIEALGGDPAIAFVFEEAENTKIAPARRMRALQSLDRLLKTGDPRLARRDAAATDVKSAYAATLKDDPTTNTANVIGDFQLGFQDCYAKALAKKPGLVVQGTLTLKVEQSGKVAESTSTDITDPDVAKCVEKVGKDGQFAPHKDAKPKTVRIPIMMKGA